MYTPQHFAVDDPEVLLDLMRRHSFATLVTAPGGVPFATHMPFVVESGALLSSHIARANPQWQGFDPGLEVLVIFQGDHSYVSPSWYQKHPSVPTWNYVTVHAYGKPRIVEEPEAVKAMLHKLVAQYEHKWKMEDLEDKYLSGMMKGIVAFEIEVTRLEGKFKLSQNRGEPDRRGVIEALSASESPGDRAVAGAMRRNLEKLE